jgi:hypothetical protein
LVKIIYKKGVFPIQTSLKIWDLLFFDGSIILFEFTLAYLKLNLSTLLIYEDFTLIFLHLQDACKFLFDFDILRVFKNFIKEK